MNRILWKLENRAGFMQIVAASPTISQLIRPRLIELYTFLSLIYFVCAGIGKYYNKAVWRTLSNTGLTLHVKCPDPNQLGI